MTGAPLDPAMPFMEAALSIEAAGSALSALPGLPGRVIAARLTRHKPGRRCVIEYDVATPSGETTTIIGKARAKGTDTKTFRVMSELAECGFNSTASDGIAVPELLGTVPQFNMWLQRKAAGVPAAELLGRKDAVSMADRVADAVFKIHHCTVMPPRKHAVADELAILNDRLGKVRALHPEWRTRIDAVLAACHAIAEAPPAVERPIHRDFHPGQILLDGAQTWLLDFDLFALGDPAVDVGNFVAHVTEFSLRELGDASALKEVEAALVARYCLHAGESVRERIEIYGTLTLARHVWISMQFETRRRCTEAILELVEQRLATY